MTNSQWMPIIDEALCNACGICIERCPESALGWQNGKAALVAAEACRYCAACEDVCPTAAIALPYLVMLHPVEPVHSPDQTAS
ncbi:MAG: 4Fe-4S dicluster domain-containing protein [Chloroflexi bacterium CFX4]|nr:4Fe-4S dicluster domain-containing protein [Chloroflexi bacterium CFX4]MDL1923928.1 4Fe-4S dicluster domain-containing protein [Chloroflexi bacterium CFX3]